MPSQIPVSGVTQRDIARILDLSRSTVAFALNAKHQHKLQPETVKLVQNKAAELNYHPRREAQILRQGRSNSIGVIFTTPIYHAPHEDASSLAHIALSRGYQPTAIDLKWFSGDSEAARRFLMDSAPDGVVLNNLSTTDANEWEKFLRQRHIPVVRIGEIEAGENITSPAIGADRLGAFRALTSHHLECGSRKLDLLLPQPSYYYTKSPRALIRHRFSGFEEAILAAGGRVDGSEEVRRIFGIKPKRGGKRNSDIVGNVWHLDLNIDQHADKSVSAFKMGYDYILRAHGLNALPDSVICSNDNVAAGAVTAAIELGIPVPQRLRISGADDAAFSAYCGIPLTTIRPPSMEMVTWAMDELVKQMATRRDPLPSQSVILPYELIIRRSTMLHREIGR